MSEEQIILKNVSLDAFKQKIKQRIARYEASYDYSIEKSKKRHSAEMRKRGWWGLAKPFIAEDEEITEANLNDYIIKHVHGEWHYGHSGERTPKQIRETIDRRIERLSEYLHVKYEAELLIEFDTYINITTTDYNESFFDFS